MSVWNIHARVAPASAQAHIALTALSPLVSIASAPSSPSAPSSAAAPSTDDLNAPDECAVRAILLCIHLRTLGAFEPARRMRDAELAAQPAVRVSTWVGGVAALELAVLDLNGAEAATGGAAGAQESAAPDGALMAEEERLRVWGAAAAWLDHPLELLSIACLKTVREGRACGARHREAAPLGWTHRLFTHAPFCVCSSSPSSTAAETDCLVADDARGARPRVRRRTGGAAAHALPELLRGSTLWAVKLAEGDAGDEEGRDTGYCVGGAASVRVCSRLSLSFSLPPACVRSPCIYPTHDGPVLGASDAGRRRRGHGEPERTVLL